MQSFFRRLAACAALFCANPLAFLRGCPTLAAPCAACCGANREGAPVRRRALLYYRS
ncbi:hypothetical protein M5E87_23780 [Flavonifractor plautii]|nr:hypothetical protein M5E87_23780 [Flavonifractor plautii]